MPATPINERRTHPQKRSDFAVLRPAPAEGPDNVDRLLHAMIGRFTQGISPNGLALAWVDWSMHLALSPGKWNRLLEKAWTKDLRWLGYAIHSALGMPVEPCIEPLPQDRRQRTARHLRADGDGRRHARHHPPTSRRESTSHALPRAPPGNSSRRWLW